MIRFGISDRTYTNGLPVAVLHMINDIILCPMKIIVIV